MIGALILRKMFRKNQAATVERKDMEALKKLWADDVTLTIVGQPPISGKPAVEEWYRSRFEALEEIAETPVEFLLAKPYAVGFTNTVMWEATTTLTLPDGRRSTYQAVDVIELERGKAKAIRIYVADPEGEKVLLGAGVRE